MCPVLMVATGVLALPVQTALAQAALTTLRVSDPRMPFSVSLPRGWVGLDLKDGQAGVTIASKAKSPAAMMRFVLIAKQGKAPVLNPVLKREFADFEQAVQQSGATLKLVSEKPVQYGGVSGLTHVYDLSQKGKQVRMQIWFGSGSKNFYNFQLTDQKGTYSKNAGLFEAALKSVKFK
jgi:hypothetical protein